MGEFIIDYIRKDFMVNYINCEDYKLKRSIDLEKNKWMENKQKGMKNYIHP